MTAQQNQSAKKSSICYQESDKKGALVKQTKTVSIITYSSPSSENTSPLHMTRVRPVWDNLCKKEGVVTFLTIINTATYNYNQHLQSSINGLANTCCFFGTCTPQVKNITKLKRFLVNTARYTYRELILTVEIWRTTRI